MGGAGSLNECVSCMENAKIKKADFIGRHCVAYFRSTLSSANEFVTQNDKT